MTNKGSVSKKSDEEIRKKVINILTDIGIKTGYNFFFENVNINYNEKKKLFSFTGNKKESQKSSIEDDKIIKNIQEKYFEVLDGQDKEICQMMMKELFEAGQKSKDEEIRELQAEIGELKALMSGENPQALEVYEKLKQQLSNKEKEFLEKIEKLRQSLFLVNTTNDRILDLLYPDLNERMNRKIEALKSSLKNHSQQENKVGLATGDSAKLTDKPLSQDNSFTKTIEPATEVKSQEQLNYENGNPDDYR